MKASRFRKILKFHTQPLKQTNIAWQSREEKAEETAKRLRREKLRNMLLNRSKRVSESS